jgi:two-component system sensor histidine kinase UhpB
MMGGVTTRRKTARRKTKDVEAPSDAPTSSRHRRASESRESAAYLAAIVESADDAIISKTLDGIVTSWNASAERIFGYSAQEMIGQPILRLIPPDRQSEEDLILTRLRAGERIEHFETIRARKDGRSLEVSLTISPVRNKAGAIIGASKIARDITERRKLEDALRRSHDELEQRVHERTRDLASANRALRRLSREVLEVQERERRRIARELHDEIGQALTGVKIMLETAQRTAESNGTTGTTASERTYPWAELREAIEDALSRVRAVSLDLRPPMLDSVGLLPTLLWHCETYTAQTGIQVEFQHSGLDQRFAPEVETGAYRIVQEALTNVARHAAVPQVRVLLMATEAALHLFVVDEGAGFKSDDAIATGKSTGLTSMRERATLLGGVFLVSSTPGAGTTIEAELPRTTSHAPHIEDESGVMGA